MVACKHCQTPNSLDSVFCKRCGTTLEEADVQAARANLEALLVEGNKAFAEGRTDDAMAIAEDAVLSDPQSSTALALKGLVHERRGELAEALECYEAIVERHPDSSLDRIKLNQLRNSLVAHARAAPGVDRRWALLSAIATMVLLGSLGALYLRSTLNPPTTADMREGDAKSNFETKGFQPSGGSVNAPNNANGGSPIGATPANPNGNPADPNANQSGGGSSPFQGTGRQEPLLPRADGNVLPKAGGPEPVIITPEGPLTGNIGNSSNGGSRRSDSGTTNPPGRNEGDPPPVAEGNAATQEPDPGMIDITISEKTGARLNGGGQTIPDNPGANGVRALLETARNQFETGNYAASATNFERALRAGADAGPTNQRLGMAYDRLGRKADAINAYGRAVDAFEAEVRSGRGGERAQRALDSSKAALKALRGN